MLSILPGNILGDPGADSGGARESLNRRNNMARRKVKNGEKIPCGQCLTRPVPNGRRRSGFWLGRKTQTFSGNNQKRERRRPFGTGLVRHCPQGLYSPFFTFLLRDIFFRPFRLSLVSTICPWVSEDAKCLSSTSFPGFSPTRPCPTERERTWERGWAFLWTRIRILVVSQYN